MNALVKGDRGNFVVSMPNYTAFLMGVKGWWKFVKEKKKYNTIGANQA